MKEFVKILNEQWLKKYFAIEEKNRIQLSNSRGEIINKGGKIFFAMNNNEVVGTVSLMKVDDETYELSKMAVIEKYQSMGIGKLLLEHSNKTAKELGMKKLILYSSTKLPPAIHLYRKYGFKEVKLTDSIYKRSDIKMEKFLD